MSLNKYFVWNRIIFRAIKSFVIILELGSDPLQIIIIKLKLRSYEMQFASLLRWKIFDKSSAFEVWI